MWESKAYGNSQGGFMNKSTVQSPAQKPKTGSRTQNIIPMCIRQILQCSDEGLKIASYDVHMNETSRNLPDIVENMYCRIFGSMRTSHGKKHVFVFKIRKLSSLNDLTRHLLEVIHCPLKLEIMARKDSAKEAEKDISDASMSNSFMSSSVRNATGFNTQQELVYNAIIVRTALLSTGPLFVIFSIWGVPWVQS
ncbi:hypothetical protein C0J52_17836 [Blattella germanica]|nr:hypothetical protein C0J52_17836 [Blattella germanica]